MTTKTRFKCTVAGSFEKFKPEIDRTIGELRDLGVVVLAPETGWVLRPRHEILRLLMQGFRPLPSEVGMSIGQIEDSFLAAIARSDFLYVVNPEGYVGQVVAMEIGFSLAMGILVFSRLPVSPTLDADPAWGERVARVKCMEPQEVVKALESRDKTEE